MHSVYCTVFNIFLINVGICAYFVYYKYMNRNKKDIMSKCLNIMVMFIMCNIKWGKSNKLILKIEHTIFTTTLSISKILMQGC